MILAGHGAVIPAGVSLDHRPFHSDLIYHTGLAETRSGFLGYARGIMDTLIMEDRGQEGGQKVGHHPIQLFSVIRP
jgi:hypothetical protein